VIVTQPEVQSRIGKRAVIIENFAIAHGVLIDKAYLLSKLIRKDDFFRVVYVGNISHARGLMEMVRAMGILNQKIVARLWLIGSSSNINDLREAKQDNAWTYVDYLGRIPQEQAFAYMLNADAGLVTILDVADHKNTSANKIYEYQRFSLPFVASNFQKWIDQLKLVGSGHFVDPSNPNLIADALYWIATNREEAAKMGQRGQNLILEKYNWETESEKFLNLYSDLGG
jgi:glycosyltransferase involved in cell wall biosynthesis